MNKKYYGLDRKEATELQSKTSQLTNIPGIVMILIGGFLYDIFGRQMTLCIMTLVSGFIFILFPLVAPSPIMYIVVSSLYSLIV